VRYCGVVGLVFVLLGGFPFAFNISASTLSKAQVYSLDDIVSVTAIDFHPIDSVLIIAGEFSAGFGFYLYDIQTEQISYIGVQQGEPRSVYFSPDGKLFISSIQTQSTLEYQVFDSIGGQIISVVEHGALETFDIAWSADSNQYAVPIGFEQHGITIINVMDGLIAREFAIDRNELVGTLSLSWDVTRLYVLHGARQISVWNTTTKTRTALFPIATNANSLRVSPDGTKLALASSTGNVEILDTLTGSKVSTLKSSGGIFSSSVVWSPKSNKIASFVVKDSGMPNTIQIWDIPSGRLEKEIEVFTYITPSQILFQNNLLIYVSNRNDEIFFVEFEIM